jgi:hypothetical protein
MPAVREMTRSCSRGNWVTTTSWVTSGARSVGPVWLSSSSRFRRRSLSTTPCEESQGHVAQGLDGSTPRFPRSYRIGPGRPAQVGAPRPGSTRSRRHPYAVRRGAEVVVQPALRCRRQLESESGGHLPGPTDDGSAIVGHLVPLAGGLVPADPDLQTCRGGVIEQASLDLGDRPASNCRTTSPVRP